MIQYPVETGNDAGAAVNYIETYISTLPPRPKKIVMVSVGSSDTNNIVSAAKQRLSSKNTTLDFVSVTGGQPLANLPSSGRSSPPRQTTPQQSSSPGTASGTTSTGTSGSATPSAGTTSSTPKTQGNSQTGAQSTTQGTPKTGAQSTTQNTSQTGTQPTTQQGISQTGAQSTTQQSTAVQDTSTVSKNAAGGEGSSAQGVSPSGVDRPASEQNYDSSGTDTSTAKAASKKQNDSSVSFSPTLLLILGIIAAILLLTLLLIFASRRLRSSPNRVMASVSALSRKKESKFTENKTESKFTDHSKDLANYAANQNKKRVTPYSNKPVKEQVVKQPTINPTDPVLINLFVEDQSTSIGKRNIHSLKSGYSLSVGGGKSDDFLIFLVPMPSNIGEISRKGSQITFTPHKPKYFPDIGSNDVKDCINKRIRVISEKNYEMWFSFVIYEDPLIALNRVLHSVKVPG